MDSKRSKVIKSPATSNKGDESRKENTVNCYTSPPAKMSRRNTVFRNNIPKKPVTAMKRRQTIFIDPVDISSNNSKQLEAPKSTKTKLFGSDSIKKDHRTTSSTKNRIANRLAGHTREKLNDHPPASKHNLDSSHRENDRPSSSSSIHRTSVQVPPPPSSSHRHSSTSHPSMSSSKRTESQRQSISTESTGHRSDYKKHRTNKRKSFKDRHDQDKKRQRPSETKTKIFSEDIEPKTPVPGKVHNGNTDKSKELEVLDDSSDSLDLLIPLYSVDPPNPKVIVKKKMPKNKKGNHSAKRVPPTEPKTIKAKKRNSKSQSRELPNLAPAMNPSVLLRRLKFNSSKLDANDKTKLNVVDSKYFVYDVNGVLKIKKKKKNDIHDGRHSKDGLSVTCKTKDKSNDVADKKIIEHTSHARHSKDGLSETKDKSNDVANKKIIEHTSHARHSKDGLSETKDKSNDVANKKIIEHTSHARHSKDGLSETKDKSNDVANKKIIEHTSHARHSKDGLSETKDKSNDVANKKIIEHTSHARHSKDGLSETKAKSNDVAKKEIVESCNFSTQTNSVITRSIGIQKVDNEVETMTKKHNESIALFTESVREYETAVCEQQQKISSLKEALKEQKDNVNERENKIAERERMIAERDLKITERERMIAERDSKIAERDSQIKELEEEVKLQDSKIKYMMIEMDRLMRSEKSLSALLKENDAKCKENHQNDNAMPAKTLNVSKVLQNGADTTYSPIRVKNIDQLRDKSCTSINNQPFCTMSPSAINTTANLMLPGQSAEVNQTTNFFEWTVDAPTHNYLQATQFSQKVAPSPIRYVRMYNPPATTQSTTATANTNTNNSQPTTPHSILTNTTPHQNLPRIIQKATRPMPIRLKTSSTTNNPSGSQMRGRSTSCYYGSQPIADSTSRNSISTNATPNPNLPSFAIIQKAARPIPIQPKTTNTMTQSNNPYDLISSITQEGSGSMQDQSHAAHIPRNRSKSFYYDAQGSTYQTNILRYRQILQRQESQNPSSPQQPSPNNVYSSKR